nr:MAG TPA: hypothetical protein [Caudoviricetes sp.]
MTFKQKSVYYKHIGETFRQFEKNSQKGEIVRHNIIPKKGII